MSNRTSATSGGLTFSVGSTVSDGASTSDDLLLVAALRRTEANAAYQAIADQVIIYGLCTLASAGLRHATSSGADWRSAFANGN